VVDEPNHFRLLTLTAHRNYLAPRLHLSGTPA
jgi:hypothetical protein